MTGHDVQDYLRSTYSRRKAVDRLVTLTLYLAAALALIPLFSVLGYVVFRGFPNLDLSFFVENPKPVGETGGGMNNAFVGTCFLVALSSSIGVTWGIASGIYLSEYGRGRLGSIVRFCTDMLSSVPSITVGLF